MEYWKNIEGYKGLYQVSNFGKVRNTKTKLLLKLFISKNGYCHVSLSKKENNKRKIKSYLVHRLVAMAFIQNSKNERDVNHKDGNKLNNSVENLEWCSHSENLNHAWENHLINVSSELRESGRKIGKKYGIKNGKINGKRELRR